MNGIDQDVPIGNADELASRREDPLVTAVHTGAPEAFAQLYAIYSPRLYRTITAITKNPEDAQDALQETFLRAHLYCRDSFACIPGDKLNGKQLGGRR
jgi:hypothetical protein